MSGRIGGDAPLSEKGRKFAKALAKFTQTQRIRFACELASRANELEPEEEKTHAKALQTTAKYCNSQFTVWTSMLQRSMQTAENFDPDDYDIKHIRFLNEINSGVSLRESSLLFYYQVTLTEILFYRFAKV